MKRYIAIETKMIPNVPKTEARMMIRVLRLMPELADDPAVELEKGALVVAVDVASPFPGRLSAPDVEAADRMEEIAIVFVIIDVTEEDVNDDSSFLELVDVSGFIVLGDSEGDASDNEKSFIATNVWAEERKNDINVANNK